MVNGQASVALESGRVCGDCTLCCTLLPVPALDKASLKRCVYQQGKGCEIYAARPKCCQTWSCRWLAEPEETANLKRPDQSHYLVDCFLDTIEIQVQGEQTREIEALQVWVDPEHRDAYQDPALLSYLNAMGQLLGLPAIIRFSSHDGFALFPPALSKSAKWFELHRTAVDD